MRTMLLFRGAPGCGKSTMIKQLGIEPYTLSADDIRLLLQSPQLNVDGSYSISQDSESKVWDILFQALENRMARGEFVAIDATNSKTSDMTRYKDLAEQYRYRIYIKDLTDLPMEECIRRNANRLPEYKRVPKSVIENQYARFATQGIPGGIKRLTSDDIIKEMSFDVIDFSGYNRIHIIGDIHGCYTALKEFMDKNWNKDDLFIFTGDYLDRGLENAEALNYIFELSKNSNTIFIEGNHEKWLRNWASDLPVQSREFNKRTLPQIEDKVSKKEARMFCRKLRQFAYFKFHDNVILATHGGVPLIPENLLFFPTKNFIEGIGEYEEALDVDLAFETNMPENYIQVHGHRNMDDILIMSTGTGRSFNLEGQVELGGELRAVTFSKGKIETHEIKNDVFRTYEADIPDRVYQEMTDEMMFDIMANNELVITKKLKCGLTSFNFKPSCFQGRLWDTATIKARGLFFDSVEKKIVLRSYDKFFNIGERANTKIHSLKNNLVFPVREFVKYNGFLGLVGVFNDELIFSSKSSVGNEHSRWLKEIFMDKTTPEQREKIKEFIKSTNTTFVFEVINPENDPHIIKYDEKDIVLLDIILNKPLFEKVPYESAIMLAKKLGLRFKELVAEYSNWSDFYANYVETIKPGYQYKGEDIEGFVIEDSEGFMTKSKLFYYKQWKQLRDIAHRYIKYEHIKSTSSLINPEMNYFYGWLRNKEKDDVVGKDIITLRDMFYKDSIA